MKQSHAVNAPKAQMLVVFDCCNLPWMRCDECMPRAGDCWFPGVGAVFPVRGLRRLDVPFPASKESPYSSACSTDGVTGFVYQGLLARAVARDSLRRGNETTSCSSVAKSMVTIRVCLVLVEDHELLARQKATVGRADNDALINARPLKTPSRHHAQGAQRAWSTNSHTG